MRTLRDVDLGGKTVILRADYNLPIDDGKVTNDYRMRQALPTLEYILGQNCRVVIISHLGRPDGRVDPKYSLSPVASHLEGLLGRPVVLAPDIADVNTRDNQITMLENIRFWPQETANDEEFARQLASLGDICVEDCFGVAHRAHASIDAITRLIPSVAGLLLIKEYEVITQAMSNPDRPLAAIVGGAKVSDKLEVLHALIPQVDHLIIGGAMANTFMINSPEDKLSTVGQSLHETDMAQTINELYRAIAAKFGVAAESDPRDYKDERVKNFIYLPRDDVRVAKEINASQSARVVSVADAAEDDIILDFGPKSLAGAIEIVSEAKTVLWNGPLGMIELPEFAQSSKQLAEAISRSDAFSIIGGGDTAGFVQQLNMVDDFDWVSTGGGATLDLIAGKSLPGIAALQQDL